MNRIRDHTKKWLTKTIYVDQDTGEILEKRQVERHYIIVNTLKRSYEDGHYNIREHTRVCTRSKQTELFG